VDIWRIQAHSLVETKDYRNAVLAFGGLERRNAVKPEDYVKLGKAFFSLNQEEKALDYYLQAIAADSANCDPYFDLGFLYMKKQDFVKAAGMFEKKIACDPRSLSAYLNGGACYMQMKNFDRARALFLKSIELKQDFLQGHLWLGRYYVQVDSFELAQQQYEDVLKLIGDQTEKYRKESGEGNSLLGSLYMTRKQYERAIESFRRAQAVGYENGAMHLSWGQAILQTIDVNDPQEVNRKKNEDAVKQFRRCVDMEPGNSQGHFWLGEGLIRLRIPGEDEANKKLKEEACTEFKKVVRLDPKNPDAPRAMERVGCQ
jgi:tetratricopeptide (TPR) repeat protein